MNDMFAAVLLGAHRGEIEEFVKQFKHWRHHGSLNDLTPAHVYFGRVATLLLERERIKRRTI